MNVLSTSSDCCRETYAVDLPVPATSLRCVQVCTVLSVMSDDGRPDPPAQPACHDCKVLRQLAGALAIAPL